MAYGTAQNAARALWSSRFSVSTVPIGMMLVGHSRSGPDKHNKETRERSKPMGSAAQLRPVLIRHRKQSSGKPTILRDASRAGLGPSRKARERLQLSLPSGWQSFFDVRRAGKYWALPRECPVCQARPEVGTPDWNKWRWVMAHLRMEHV